MQELKHFWNVKLVLSGCLIVLLARTSVTSLSDVLPLEKKVLPTGLRNLM